MARDALVEPLLKVELFQGLSPLQISEIARRAGRIVYKPGEPLIREDEAGDAAILIISGEAVRLPGSQSRRRPALVAQGSLIGEMAMLVETTHSATIVARTIVRALKISRTDLVEQMRDDPALARHFEEKITGRLVALAAELRRIDGMASRPFVAPARPEMLAQGRQPAGIAPLMPGLN